MGAGYLPLGRYALRAALVASGQLRAAFFVYFDRSSFFIVAIRGLNDGDEFDIKRQLSGRGPGHSAVGQIFGNPEPVFVPDRHQLDAFRPSGNDLIEPKFCGLPAFDRRVEHLSVRRPPRIMDANP